MGSVLLKLLGLRQMKLLGLRQNSQVSLKFLAAGTSWRPGIG